MLLVRGLLRCRHVPGGARRAYATSSATANASGSLSLSASLKDSDPEVFDIIEHEKCRQRNSLTLIPSENFTSRAVLDALGSVMQNKYSEGYPGARYYGGNEHIDAAENLCRARALEAFGLDAEEWGVNVQPLSGSPANLEVYNAVLAPHERMMALDLPHGGHLSHGYAIPGKKISAVSAYFESVPYRLDEATGLIDYEMMEKVAAVYRPKLLVGGASAYARHVDYARMRGIADQHGAFLMSDMAHISGLVAAGVSPSPFEHCDIVTTTTHKSLRGPRGAMIFFRRGERVVDAGAKKPKVVRYDLEDRINASVFPGHQGGPHNHTITALAVALKQAAHPDFKAYQQRVVDNCKTLADGLLQRGYTLVSGGTDNHLLLVDLRPLGITGSKVERVMEEVNIAVNKNTVPGDRSAMNPHGIRLGTPAMTTRGLAGADFEQVAEFLHRAIQLALQIQDAAPTKKLVDFNKVERPEEVGQLKKEVGAFVRGFGTVGFEEGEMVYPGDE